VKATAPESRTPMVSSVVATGRRMKGEEKLEKLTARRIP